MSASVDALTAGLLEASRHPLVILNAAASIVAANERAAEVLGEPLAELVGRSALDPAWNLRDASNRPLLDTRIAPRLQFEQSPASLRGTVEVSRRDGSRIWIEVTAMPVFTEARALAWIIASFNQVSMTDERLAVERRRARFTLINSVLEGMSLGADQAATVDGIAKRLSGRLGELVVIRALEDGERLPIVAAAGSTPAMTGLARSIRNLPPIALGQSLSGTVSASGRGIAITDSADFNGHLLDDWRPVMADHGIASAAVLPLRWNGQVVGTLSVCRTDIREAFTQEELIDLEPLLDWIAYAMVSSQQAEAGRQAAALLEALVAINRTAVTPDASLVADVAVRQLATALHCAAAVHVVEADGDRIRFFAGAGFESAAVRRSGSLSSGYLGRVAAGAAIAIADLNEVEDWDRPELLREQAAAGYEAVPIRSGAAIYGVLEIFRCKGEPEPQTAGLLSAVAGVLGAVLALAAPASAASPRQPATPAIRGGYQLTPSELNILRLVAEGLSNVEIAQRVHLSPETIKFHLSNLYRRLSVNNRAELVALATKRGWV